MSVVGKLSSGVGKIEIGLVKTHEFIDRVYPPISELVVRVASVDGYVANALSFFDFLDHVLALIHDALQLTKYLAKLIPEVGPTISKIVEAIEDLHIEGNIRQIVVDLKKIIKDVKQNVTDKLKEASNTVLIHLTNINDDLPGWIDTTKIMRIFFTAADFVQDLGGQDFAQEAVEKLKEFSNGLLGKLDPIEEALKPLIDFVSKIWNELKEKIDTVLHSGFNKFLEILKPVKGLFTALTDVCRTVEEWFKPFTWIIGKIEWIIHTTIGWLLEKIEKKMDIAGFVKGISTKIKKTLEEDLKLNVLHDQIYGLFEKALKDDVKNIYDVVDANLLVTSVQEFSARIKEFQRDPATTIVTIVGQALPKNPDDEPPVPPLPPPHTGGAHLVKNNGFASISSLQAISTTTSPAQKRPTLVTVEAVQSQQSRIDVFVQRTAFPRPPPHIGIGAPSAAADVTERSPALTSAINTSVTAPKLTYASFNNQPVSVILRIQHQRVLQSQSDTLSATLAPLQSQPFLQPLGLNDQSVASQPQLRVDDPAPVTATAVTATAGSSPNFNAFCVKYDEFTKVANEGSVALGKLTASAKQVDDAFASYTGEAGDMCQHLIALLQGFDPIFAAIESLAELPLKYRDALTHKVDNWFGDDVVEAFELVFKGFGTFKEAILHMVAQQSQVLTSTQAFNTTYQNFHKHLAAACSPDRFPPVLFGPAELVDFDKFVGTADSDKLIGSRVNTATQLVAFLVNRIESTTKCFANFVELRKRIIDNHQDAGADPQKLAATLNELEAAYASLTPFVEAATKQIHDGDIEARVIALFGAMQALWDDMKTFYNASHTVNEQCRKLEAKLIAGDHLRAFCARVNNSVAPFESILQQCGINAGPIDPAPILKAAGNVHMPKTLLEGVLDFTLQGLDKFIAEYFHLDEITGAFSTLGTELNGPIEQHIKNFDDRMTELVQALAAPHQSTSPNLVLDGNTLQPIFEKFQGLLVESHVKA